MHPSYLIGPFRQLLTMNQLALKGPIKDGQMEIIENAGIWVEDGIIKAVDRYEALLKHPDVNLLQQVILKEPLVAMPGMIDCHTHLCFAGSRARDYQMRVSGKSYLDIARAGGGIMDSVRQTRQANKNELLEQSLPRAQRHLKEGVTTIEIKSGYGLNLEDELKMLEVIGEIRDQQPAFIISTCLAAHLCPPEFGDKKVYLNFILEELMPLIRQKRLARRMDIFVEDTAFNQEEAGYFLGKIKEEGFSFTVHADQFHCGGSKLAVLYGAASADHLEASGEEEIRLLGKSDTVAVVLPGASLGLGMPYAPARKLLDAGACLAIASDWNPGSAPMGDLLMQASVLGAAEKLTPSETLSGITFRAARALELNDRGILAKGYRADFIAFATEDYREILYQQGKLKPDKVFVNGTILPLSSVV